MKVIEVQFDGHVKVPHAQRGTNVLKTTADVSIGGSVLVDTIEEKDNGIFVTKRLEKEPGRWVTYRKLYAWHCVNEVVYEPDVQKEVPKVK